MSIVFLLVLLCVFFIVTPFSCGRFTGAENPNPISPFSEANDKQAILQQVLDNYFTEFFARMLLIVENTGERIGEYRQGLFEGDSMFYFVGKGFSKIPLEL
jgi:hypothetical protein